MVEHGVPTPVLRVLQFLEDWPIERLTDAEHKSLAGADDGAVARGKLWLPLTCAHGSPVISRHRWPKPSAALSLMTTE